MAYCGGTYTRIIEVPGSGSATVDFTALSPAQTTALCALVVSSCDVATSLQRNVTTGALELLDGQSDILSSVMLESEYVIVDTLAQVPPVTTLPAGRQVTVLNDPDPTNDGLWIVGGTAGALGTSLERPRVL